MKRIDKLLAAFVLGLAVSYPPAPSVAQQAPPMSRARAGDPRMQRRGQEICRTYLGRRGVPDLSLLHGAIRPEGVARDFPGSAPGALNRPG